jgi:tetratricopeptide (TPR) repeat protein
MAYWGMAMSHYHQLWQPQVDSEPELREGAAEITRAARSRITSPREREFIVALDRYYTDLDHAPPSIRTERYANAMEILARRNPDDDEAQIYFALALIATAPPEDKTHRNQKRAIAILDPIWRRQPNHPGLAHYLIHACDSADLAPRGLAAARAYSKIAPSVPHALHMPSHIFTRLGLWEDSVRSNRAARAAAQAQGDVGEEFHAMDYLTYAYLQLGRTAEASKVVTDAKVTNGLTTGLFKVAYAATAIPVRVAVETQNWDATSRLQPLPGAPSSVTALVYWARALGHARSRIGSPDADITQLKACLDALRASRNTYWATQVEAMLKEAQAWRFAESGDSGAAVASLRSAAEEEEAVEKLPITPGPVVPAREQLGELLLNLNRPAEALHEFKAALILAPGRRAARLAAMAAQLRLTPPHTHE